MGSITTECPHCHTENSLFTSMHETILTENRAIGNLYSVVFECVCKKSIICEYIHRPGSQSPNQHHGVLDGNYVLQDQYPKPAIIDCPAHVPESPHKRYLEAQRTFRGKNYEAAGSMARKVLESAVNVLVKNIKLQDRANLYSKIDALADNQIITSGLKDWAHAIRKDGNAFVHDDDDAGDNTEEQNKIQADQIIKFVELFLMYTFTLPGMLVERSRKEDADSSSD